MPARLLTTSNAASSPSDNFIAQSSFRGYAMVLRGFRRVAGARTLHLGPMLAGPNECGFFVFAVILRVAKMWAARPTSMNVTRPSLHNYQTRLRVYVHNTTYMVIGQGAL